MKRIFSLILAAAAAFGVPAQQAYPIKNVTIVLPFPAAGFNDQIARIVADKLSNSLGKPVVVDNKPGGGGTIGTALVAKSQPDGHTIIAGNMTTFAINSALFEKLPYDPVADFIPVTTTARVSNVLVVNPAVLKVNSVAELLAYARANPGKLNFAGTGTGSSPHLSGELLKQRTKTDIVHISYKGSAPAVTDLLGGQVHVMFDNIPNVLQHIKAGKLKALAVTSAERLPALPDVPTMQQAGVPDFVVDVWFGMLVPAKTPQNIVERLNKDIREAMLSPDVTAMIEKQGARTFVGSSDEFSKLIRSQIAWWAPVVKASGAKQE